MKEMSSALPNSPYLIGRLTALWALAESGLGGYMFAMKIPFTGIILGGTAIVILSLIAWFSSTPFKSILRATLVVLLVKFSVSPHTAPPAYVAVAFQGLMAALLLSSSLSRAITLPLFMLIAMLESAWQKFIIATVFYGKEIWAAMDESALKIASELGISLEWASDFSFKMLAIYSVIYALWGLLLSFWVYHLPFQMELKKEGIISRFPAFRLAAEEPDLPTRKRKKRRWIGLLFITLFLAGSFFVHYGKDQALEKALLLLVRTILILLFYLYALAPLLKVILKNLANSEKNKRVIHEILATLPELKKLLPVAWNLAQASKTGWRRYPEFILNMIVLSLYLDGQDSDI